MKKDVKILSFEEKKTKDEQKYVRVETSEGWASIFDHDLASKIKGSIDQTLCVEWLEKGNFKNITKFYGVSDKPIEDKVEPNPTPASIKVTQPRPQSNPTDTSVYTSYTKDVFIALLANTDKDLGMTIIMEEAIMLVQKAREAFQ